ncbi:MAG: hypothetical protein JNK64_02715 [Myxococcales bacterium]|nr:hypothetical protein [Myxococcales bacterium]
MELAWSPGTYGAPSLAIEPISHWAMSPDDRHVIVAGVGADAGRVRCIEVATAREVATVVDDAPVTALAWRRDAWIVRAGATATVTVHALPDPAAVARAELPGLRALRHHLAHAGDVAWIARAELDRADRREPNPRLGWLVDPITAAPRRAIARRELDDEAVAIAGRHQATALRADGGGLAAAFGPAQRATATGVSYALGAVATLDLRTGHRTRSPRALDLAAHELQFAGATLVVRTARDDTGGHAARLGRVLVLDPHRDAWIYDSDQRARDPVATSEYEAAGAHADVHPRGDRIVVVGHALYLPQERSLCSHVHARGYVIATPGGACLRTLEIETNPFDAVGAVWCDDGDDLDVLVDRSGHWGIARYRADGCQPLHRFEQDGVLLGARLWRTPGRRYPAITGRVWPQRHLRLMLVRAAAAPLTPPTA